jgi:SNF2 family DNA or RNA helicase
MQSEERPRHESRHQIPVAIIDIICEDTVDELVLESNRDKKNMSDYVRGNIDRVSKAIGI